MSDSPRGWFSTVVAVAMVAGIGAAGWTVFGSGPAAPRHTRAVSARQPTPGPTAEQRAAELWRAQDWPAAATAYGALAQSAPDNGLFAYRHAYALHATGQYEKAAAAHERAAAFPPFRAVALYNLGCAEALLGHPDEAFAALDRAFIAGFRNKAQVEGDSDLLSLHDDPRWERYLGQIERLEGGHALAFWVGSWEVRDAAGTLVGTNIITLEHSGAIVREEWTGAAGGTGSSMNFLDHRSGKWRQVWVDSRGGIVDMSGDRQPDGSVVLVGDRVAAPNAISTTRATFSPLPDGRVRQLIETSSDEGKTWSVGFDGYYSAAEPKPAEAAAVDPGA